MRNRFTHTTPSKNIQNRNLRNRFFHSTQSTQPTQPTQSVFVSDEITRPIQPTQSVFVSDEITSLPDDMDFQYDYDHESNHSQNNNNESSEELLEDESDDYKEIEESSENEEIDEDDDDYRVDDDDNESEDDDYDDDDDDDDNDNNKSESSKDEDEYGNIIDEALDKDKMPFYNNNDEFAPYFENFTTAALFCWLQKHNISTNAYENLVEIIHNSQFVPADVIKNVRRFRKWRQHLPLLPISEKSISISSKNTPSTSKNSKMAYQLSINDIIWYVLNNPSLMKHMYFGPGIDSEIKSEYWHGTLWGESPFFGQEKITISRG